MGTIVKSFDTTTVTEYTDIQTLFDSYAGKTIRITGDLSITSNLNIPSDTFCKFINNSKLVVSTGIEITGLNIQDNPQWQILDGDLTNVEILNMVINPVWIGETNGIILQDGDGNKFKMSVSGSNLVTQYSSDSGWTVSWSNDIILNGVE